MRVLLGLVSLFALQPHAILQQNITQYGMVGPWSQTLEPVQQCNSKPRYFLFGANPLEGFSARRKFFIRAAYLYLMLDGPWTLVLPPFLLTQHWRHAHDSEDGRPWRDFFDVQHLQKTINVIEWEDYKAMHGPRVDLTIWPDQIKMNVKQMNDQKFMSDPAHIMGHISCEKQPQKYFLSQWEPSGDLTHAWSYYNPSSYGHLLSKEHWCVRVNGKMLPLWPDAITNSRAQSVLLDRIEFFMWGRVWNSPLMKQLIAQQRFAPQLYAIAEAFISQHFHGQIFIAAHIRSGDFPHFHPKSCLTKPQYAEYLLKEVATHQAQHVFIASNMDRQEHKDLSALLPYVSFSPRFSEAFHSLHEGQVAIVDQIISSMATQFIGTKESFFTGVIHEEVLKNHPDAVTQYFAAEGLEA